MTKEEKKKKLRNAVKEREAKASMSHLTERQQSIVDIESNTDNRRIACLASAGSGKSTVIENRVTHLVNDSNVSPDRIALFSFSRAATKEIRTRLKSKLGFEKFNNLTVSTLHSYCYHLVKDDYDDREGKETPIKVINNNQLEKAVMNFISNANYSDDIAVCEAEEYMTELLTNQKHNCKPVFEGPYNKLHKEITEWKRINSLYTFDDLLEIAYKMLSTRPELLKREQNRYDYWFIDEAQDTTRTMIDIFELLLRDDSHLLISFDIVQSLYQFAGADPFYLIEFVDRIGGEIRQLDETFRFGPSISEVADLVVQNVNLDERYKLFTQTNQSSHTPLHFSGIALESSVKPVCDDIERKLDQGVELSDINVLSRTNKPLVEFQKELAARGIPSRMKFGYIWERKEIKLLLSLVKVVQSLNLSELSEVIRLLPGNYNIDKKRLQMMRKESKSDSVIEFLDYFLQNKVKGIGHTITGSIRKLKKLFETATHIIENYSPDHEAGLFTQLANAVNINECDFMLAMNKEGEPQSAERWEFIGILDRFHAEKNISAYDIEAALKIEFMTEDEKDSNNAVALKTIHSSKGETLPYVYLLANTFNEKFMKDDNEITSEMFVLYVAVTRTKTELQIWGDLPEPLNVIEEALDTTEMGDENVEQAEKPDIIEQLKTNPFIRKNRKKDVVPITVNAAKVQTANAVLCELAHQGNIMEEWIPKSQLVYSESDDRFLIPRWLYKKKIPA